MTTSAGWTNYANMTNTASPKQQAGAIYGNATTTGNTLQYITGGGIGAVTGIGTTAGYFTQSTPKVMSINDYWKQFGYGYLNGFWIKLGSINSAIPDADAQMIYNSYVQLASQYQWGVLGGSGGGGWQTLQTMPSPPSPPSYAPPPIPPLPWRMEGEFTIEEIEEAAELVEELEAK